MKWKPSTLKIKGAAMSKQQPRKPKLSANLAALSLNIPTPEQTEMQLSPMPTQGGMLMMIPVTEIDFFDKNPRKHHDEESFNHIKESIRSLGVLQPVHITQRPNETRYTLAQGGNTRLKIMRELFDETGDERFRMMPCLYQNYHDDTTLQIAHLIENEQRADMCFWDKAHAYAQVRELFLSDGQCQASLRAMENLFASKGLSVSHAALSLFFFTYDFLGGLGELGVGLSHAKAVELKKLHTRLFQTVKMSDKSAEMEQSFSAFWQATLQLFCEQNAHLAAWELPALLSFIEQQYSETFGEQLPETAPVTKNIETDSVKKHAPEKTMLEQSQTTKDTADTEPNTSRVNEPSGTVQLGVNPPAEPNIPTLVIDKNQLNKKLHSTVRRILNTVGLQNCFAMHDGFAYGFYIDYPPFEHFDNKNQCIFAIDSLHQDAGDVFVYLSKLSKQEYWLHQPQQSNPISTLPASSKLKIAYHDSEKLEEYNDMGIGERQNLVEKIITWHTEPTHFLYALIIELNNVMSDLNKLKLSEKGNE